MSKTKIFKKRPKRITYIRPKIVPKTIILNESTPIYDLYHISDIHISKFDSRYTEFRSVFSRLYKDLSIKPKGLIVITGDILHEKNSLSPEQIKLTKEFFINLSNIMPIIAIIGNHDISPQQNSIDSISPIVLELKTINPIHLLLDSNNYIYSNIVFGLTTIFSKIVTPIIPTHHLKTKIALYHGIIKGAKADNDFNLSNSTHFNKSDFDAYDYILLGDIHKHSYLQSNMAYAGSLIQLNMSESLDHGYIHWDIKSNISNFVKIPNDWGFIDLNVSNISNIPPNLPKYPTIRIQYSDMTLDDATKYADLIKSKYPNAKCYISRSITPNINITFEDESKILDIDTDQKVTDVVNKYITQQYDFSSSTIDLIVSKIESILKSINYNYVNKVKNLKLQTLKFSNYFNYGLDNVIDYSNMSGIFGITGDSFVGKSTAAIDVLIYALFGKAVRGDKFDTVNTKSTFMTTDITFDLNGESYRITRHRKINSKKNRDSGEKTILYKNDSNISKETIDKTNEAISNLICKPQSFINITTMMQNNFNSSFLDLSDKDRKTLLCGLLKLDIFNEILSKARSEINQINYYISNTIKSKNIKTIKTTISDLESLILKSKTLQLDLSNKIQTLIKTKDELNNSKIRLEKYSNIQPNDDEYNKTKNLVSSINCPEIKLSIKELQSKIIELASSKCRIDEDCTLNPNIIEQNSTLKQTVSKLYRTISELKSTLVDISKPPNLDLEYSELQSKINLKIDLIKSIKLKEIELLDLKTKSLKLDHKYDPNCEFCVNNSMTIQLKFYESSILDLTNRIDSLNLELDETTKFIDLNSHIIQTHDDYYTALKSNESIKSQISKLEIDHKIALKDLDISNSNLDRYFKLEASISHNSSLDNQISKLEEYINLKIKLLNLSNSIEYHKINKLHSQASTELSTIQTQHQNILDSLFKLDMDLSNNRSILNTYNKKFEEKSILETVIAVLDRGGLIDNIISNIVLPNLESSINSMLEYLTDYRIKMSYRKGCIKILKINGSNIINIDTLSGCERFVANVCFKLALDRYNNHIKTNMLILDEQIACCDDKHVDKLPALFNYIKSQYKSTIIISHDHRIKKLYDYSTEVVKIGGESFIKI